MYKRQIVGFHNAYPHYVEGDPGALPRPPASPAKKKSSGYGRSGGRGRVVRRSGASYGYNQRADAGSPDKLSRMSELSVADSVISRATTRKSRY